MKIDSVFLPHGVSLWIQNNSCCSTIVYFVATRVNCCRKIM